MRGPKSIEVGLDLKILSLKGVWEPNDVERRAAWELYVEMMTRVSIVPLSDGIAREALTSLYRLFGETREILRRYGPDIAEPKPDGQYSFGFLAIAMLNAELRPVLSHWHPQLQIWEAGRDSSTAIKTHEDAWTEIRALRESLEETRGRLQDYSRTLAKACGIPDLEGAIRRAPQAASGPSGTGA